MCLLVDWWSDVPLTLVEPQEEKLTTHKAEVLSLQSESAVSGWVI